LTIKGKIASNNTIVFLSIAWFCCAKNKKEAVLKTTYSCMSLNVLGF